MRYHEIYDHCVFKVTQCIHISSMSFQNLVWAFLLLFRSGKKLIIFFSERSSGKIFCQSFDCQKCYWSIIRIIWCELCIFWNLVRTRNFWLYTMFSLTYVSLILFYEILELKCNISRLHKIFDNIFYGRLRKVAHYIDRNKQFGANFTSIRLLV